MWQAEQEALFKKISFPISSIESDFTCLLINKIKINKEKNFFYHFVFKIYFFLRLEKNLLMNAADTPSTIAKRIEIIPY